jgi:hypothetical protein
MILSVEHELHYQYTAPVYLEPQTIYLTPRPNPLQQVDDLKIEIFPTPTLVAKNIDAEGNLQHIAHFADLTESLQVKSSFKISSPHVNTFDFLIYPFELGTMPFEYTGLTKNILLPYLKPNGSHDEVDVYANPIREKTNNDVLNFLGELVRKISSDFHYEYREEGDPISPQ